MTDDRSRNLAVQLGEIGRATFSTAIARDGWLFVSGLTAWSTETGVERLRRSRRGRSKLLHGRTM